MARKHGAPSGLKEWYQEREGPQRWHPLCWSPSLGLDAGNSSPAQRGLARPGLRSPLQTSWDVLASSHAPSASYSILWWQEEKQGWDGSFKDLSDTCQLSPWQRVFQAQISGSDRPTADLWTATPTPVPGPSRIPMSAGSRGPVQSHILNTRNLHLRTSQMGAALSKLQIPLPCSVPQGPRTMPSSRCSDRGRMDGGFLGGLVTVKGWVMGGRMAGPSECMFLEWWMVGDGHVGRQWADVGPR